MPNLDPDVPPLHDPQSNLEERLIDGYLEALGHEPALLRARTDRIAQQLLRAAAQYAALKLTEVESRAHYVRDLHDGRR
jgi:hypothetical protein